VILCYKITQKYINLSQKWGQGMNFMGRIRIPTEIANFLKQEGSQRLLVKGDAGTGKTIFVLSLLRYLSRYSQGIYVSTRVNYTDIYRYNPWVKTKIQKENIIDATNPEGTLLSMESELRYNSAGDFVKIIADKCRLLRVLDMKYGCVIIDSWESLISNIPYSKRDTEIQLERIMVDLSREMKVNLILTVETTTTNRLDYVADGVVLMEKGIIHENRIRSIRLRKLRGVKIVNPVYPFTLDGGKFQALEPEPAHFEVIKCKRFRKMRASHPTYTSSGIKDFDNLMGGGLRKGSLNLLEVGNGVGFSYIPFVTVPVINALNMGMSAIIAVPEGTNSSLLKERLIGPFVRPGAFENLRVVEETYIPENELPSQVTPLKIARTHKDFLDLLEALRERVKGPILQVIGMDNIEHKYGFSNIQSDMGRVSSQNRSSHDITLLVAKEGQGITPHLGHICDSHWRLETLSKCVFMEGIIPKTVLYHTHFYNSTSGPTVRLTPLL
jgi:KaiC/GvpD/RAD55 family RecA-like ATPase